jgi:ankyrin repeat protein
MKEETVQRDRQHDRDHNCLEIIKQLLCKSANVNIADNNGITPLHLRAKMGCVNVVRDLLNAGASVKKRSGAG